MSNDSNSPPAQTEPGDVMTSPGLKYEDVVGAETVPVTLP